MPQRPRKALLFANTDWYLYNFRLSLAERLRSEGWEVVLVSPPGSYGTRLIKLGFRWIPVRLSVSSINPLRELATVLRLARVYRRERPLIAHHFTIKCVLYGTLAARWVGGISVVNAVTGLGYVFTNGDLKARIIRPLVEALYGKLLHTDRSRVIFQNNEDRDRFVQFGLVRSDRARVIRGSGVDCRRFKPRESHPIQNLSEPMVKLLFASRMLRDKGVFELLEAAQYLREKDLSFSLLFAGATYPDNPSSLSAQDIARLRSQPRVSYLGHVDNMPSLIQGSDVVVLPSYAEGTPRILLEAAAAGKAIVATSIPGCEGVVVDGVNGFLVPPRDAVALANRLEVLIQDPEMRSRFGEQSRRIAIERFDDRLIVGQTLEVYGELVGRPQCGEVMLETAGETAMS